MPTSVNELGFDPARLPKVLHYDGTPITARFIVAAIHKVLGAAAAAAPAAAPAAKQGEHA